MLRPIYIYWLKYKCDHLKRAHFGSNFTSRLIFILFLIIRRNLFFSSTFPYVFIYRFDFSYFPCLPFPPLFRSVAGKLFCYKKKNIPFQPAYFTHLNIYLVFSCLQFIFTMMWRLFQIGHCFYFHHIFFLSIITF